MTDHFSQKRTPSPKSESKKTKKVFQKTGFLVIFISFINKHKKKEDEKKSENKNLFDAVEKGDKELVILLLQKNHQLDS